MTRRDTHTILRVIHDDHEVASNLRALIYGLLNDVTVLKCMLRHSTISEIHELIEGRTIAGQRGFYTNKTVRRGK